MPFGGYLQRQRPAYLPRLASWVALAVAVSGVVVYAVQADGYQAHTTELNDGGIWVTSNRDGSYGRINKPIGELDGTVFSRLDSNLDIVQEDRDGSTMQRRSLYGAWPVKLVAGAWDASSDEALIESVTLTFDYWELSA